MARPTVPTPGPSDVWGTTVNNAIFDVSDRVDQKAPLDGTSKVPIANLPAGSVLFTTTTTRPTSRTDITVMFITVTDPGTNAFDNDIWVTA
jgi:hypothetical protein